MIFCKLKTESTTVGGSTVTEFISAHLAAKIMQYICHLLKQPGYEQLESTLLYINSLLTLQMINDKSSQTNQTCHFNIHFFQIQDWREEGDIIMVYIPLMLNISDLLSKPVGFLLHSQHGCYFMDYYHDLKKFSQ